MRPRSSRYIPLSDPSPSRGVGDSIIRRRKSLESICHCCSNRSISLTPITNLFLAPRRINPTPL